MKQTDINCDRVSAAPHVTKPFRTLRQLAFAMVLWGGAGRRAPSQGRKHSEVRWLDPDVCPVRNEMKNPSKQVCTEPVMSSDAISPGLLTHISHGAVLVPPPPRVCIRTLAPAVHPTSSPGARGLKATSWVRDFRSPGCSHSWKTLLAAGRVYLRASFPGLLFGTTNCWKTTVVFISFLPETWFFLISEGRTVSR